MKLKRLSVMAQFKHVIKKVKSNMKQKNKKLIVNCLKEEILKRNVLRMMNMLHVLDVMELKLIEKAFLVEDAMVQVQSKINFSKIFKM